MDNFLSLAMKKIRNNRPALSLDEKAYMRVEGAKAGCSATLWFMTKGCSWDRLGGCTMCNHGRGHDLTQGETMEAVRQGLAMLPQGIEELFILASGSLLDPLEVEPEVRWQIYKLIQEHPVPYFGLEARAEHVTEEELWSIKECLGNKRIGIEMGLESSNPFIREFCINKGNSLDGFISAVELVNKYQFESLANITLGHGFLTAGEALDDALSSAWWALEHGVETVVLFPMHVKPYTLLQWLYEHDLYKPPSLWQLVEVLYKIGPDVISKVDISWYKNGYSDDSKIVVSPDSCDKCRPKIYRLLDEFRKKRDFEVVKRMFHLECSCRKNEALQKVDPLMQRILDVYDEIACDFGLKTWLDDHADSIKQKMQEALCLI